MKALSQRSRFSSVRISWPLPWATKRSSSNWWRSISVKKVMGKVTWSERPFRLTETIGTKDFFDKQGENGASTELIARHYSPDGSLVAKLIPRRARERVPVAILSANTRSFPALAPIRATGGG